MLIRPEDFINQDILYCMGYASQKHDMDIHGSTFMSNHGHIAATDQKGDRLPDFCRDFFSLTARSINCFRGRRENLWACGRPNCVLVAPFLEDVADKLAYMAVNPVEAELVSHIKKWPGVLLTAHKEGLTELLIERPKFFFDEHGEMPEQVPLRITLPRLLDASEEQLRRRLQELIPSRESMIRDRVKSEKKSFLGARGVLRTSVEATPANPLPKRMIEPTVACKRQPLREAVLEWKRSRQARYDRLRQDLVDRASEASAVCFPVGTYALWKWYGFERVAWEGCFWSQLISGMT